MPKNLLTVDEEQTPVWLVFGLDKIPEAKQVKPVKLYNTYIAYNLTKVSSRTVKHPWRNAEDESFNVCLITKDPQRQYKDLINPLGLKSISKITGVTKLRTKFKPFEVRRQLCNAHDIFLADERVLPLLPKLLGKVFFEKKKYTNVYYLI